MAWEDEYHEKLRQFMVKHGTAVKFEHRSYGDYVSPYGWADYRTTEHAISSPYADEPAPCRWVIPDGAALTEESYSMFVGTFTSNNDELGVNATGCRCACGKYTDVTLRWVGSLADILWAILEMPAGKREIRL